MTETAPAAPSAPERPRLSLKKRLLLAFLSSALSLLFGLVVLEGYLRFKHRNSAPNLSCYEIDFEIGKRLKPGFVGESYGVPVSINALGMRDREATPARPDGAKRIIALGDSWTFGVCVKCED